MYFERKDGYNWLRMGERKIKLNKLFLWQIKEEELDKKIDSLHKEMQQQIYKINYEKHDLVNKLNNYVLSLWNLKGASRQLLDFIELFEFGMDQLSADSHYIYLSCLLEYDEKQKVEIGLEEHKKKYGLNGIEEYIPLAAYAYEIGYRDIWIEKAAKIWKCFSNKYEEFENYIQGKELAIVGNSDNILGKTQGKIIESKDIIFRMNTFKIVPEIESDLGKRTDIFVSNSNKATLFHTNHKNMNNYKWCIVPYDFWHLQLSQFTDSKEFLNIYSDFIDNGYKNFVCVKAKDSIELKERLGVTSPSVGIMTIWMLYKIVGKIERDWIFGFNDSVKVPGIYANKVKDTDSNKNSQLSKANEDNFLEENNRSNYFLNTPIYRYGHMFKRELLLREELISEGEKCGMKN